MQDEDVGEMDVASEFENPYDSDDPFIHDVNVNDAHDENLNDDQDSLLYHEVWDDTQQAEIDEDYIYNIAKLLLLWMFEKLIQDPVGLAY